MRRTKNAAPAAVGALALCATLAAGCEPSPSTGTDAGARDTGVPTDAPVGMDSSPRPDSGEADAGLPTSPPRTFTMAAGSGFRSPTDAVASPDGATLLFAAFTTDEEPLAAIFSVPAAGGTPTARFEGSPLAYPSGLVLSCDGATLYIADPAADPDEDGVPGAVFALSVSGASAPVPLGITSLMEPNALALDADCSDLYVSGRAMSGEAAVVRAPVAGGTGTVIAMGGELVAPTGIHVDRSGVAWVMDHLAEGPDGTGVLFSIGTGTPEIVASGLRMGTPGGVSLTPGGGTAVMGVRDGSGAAVLRTIEIETGVVEDIALPASFIDPAGLRAARGAGVFAIVDSEGSAIYRGQ